MKLNKICHPDKETDKKKWVSKIKQQNSDVRDNKPTKRLRPSKTVMVKQDKNNTINYITATRYDNKIFIEDIALTFGHYNSVTSYYRKNTNIYS